MDRTLTVQGETPRRNDDIHQVPSLTLLAREALSLAPFRFMRPAHRPAATSHDGGGAPVLVIPGFLATDTSTRALRQTLEAANYRAFGWELGRNFGVSADMFERLDRRLDEIAAIAPGKVRLVGWSLGGLYAREYAKHAPDRIDRVITLGTPFSGNMRANRAWPLYELVAGHPVDQPPLPCTLTEKPPVLTYALWSRQDGVIAPASAQGRPGERDLAIEVACRHMGFISDAAALKAIVAALANDGLELAAAA